MDIHEFHKRVIMEAVFDCQSSLFPLSIIPGEYLTNKKKTLVYEGVHFVDTSNLLSIQQPKYSIINTYFNDKGKQLVSPIQTSPAFMLKSLELQLWCENIIAGNLSAFQIILQPWIYRDNQFQDFERIAMKFPAYEAILHNTSVFQEPSEELISELDNELLRLRKMLL